MEIIQKRFTVHINESLHYRVIIFVVEYKYTLYTRNDLHIFIYISYIIVIIYAKYMCERANRWKIND